MNPPLAFTLGFIVLAPLSAGLGWLVVRAYGRLLDAHAGEEA